MTTLVEFLMAGIDKNMYLSPSNLLFLQPHPAPPEKKKNKNKINYSVN